MDSPQRKGGAPGRAYTNVALTAAAALLALDIADRAAWSRGPAAAISPAAATAALSDDDGQPTGGLVSAADQRKVMIAELRKISARLEKIETQVSKGISVKVTDMPPIKLPEPKGQG